jgi:nitroimidazol reductase NimA-like FMN-containing flavoprotein (pyridoxamine 5'-phosphate oxidase superfamily)
MDRQDIARELGQPGARGLLESATVARLAYNGPDGLPRVIPIAFYWNGERIVVCTATTAPKVRALSARPDVAITIDAGDTPAAAKSLLVRGFAHLETVDGVADEYLEAAKKALDPDTHAAFEGQVRSMYEQQVRISIEPRWARFYDFGAGRLPAFLTELAASA